jgi:hypothetical protein
LAEKILSGHLHLNLRLSEAEAIKGEEAKKKTEEKALKVFSRMSLGSLVLIIVREPSRHPDLQRCQDLFF